MTRETQDITELFFETEEPTPEQMRETEIWNEATQEAYRLVGDSSPIKLLQKTEELYQEYLKREK